MRDRFGIVERLEHYQDEDLQEIVQRSATIMGLPISPEACIEVGGRSRGTPRIANRLLRRVRDFAEVEGDGSVDLAVVRRALDALRIDEAGLDGMDRSLLRSIIEQFDGGPVGIETLAATLHEDKDTLESEIEPFLLQQAFIQRTPRGRLAMPKAYQHLGLAMSQDKQTSLFR